MTFQVSAAADSYFTGENAAYSRGFRPIYRKSGGQWMPCRVNRGAEGTVSLWYATAEEAKEAAKAWLKRAAARKRRGAVTA
jgi:hypothetical protein